MRLAPPTDEARQTLRSELAGSRNAVEEIAAPGRPGARRADPGAGRGGGARRWTSWCWSAWSWCRSPPSGCSWCSTSGAEWSAPSSSRCRRGSRPPSVQEVARILNERLAGLTLQPDPGDASASGSATPAAPTGEARAAQHLRRRAARRSSTSPTTTGSVVLGSAQMLAGPAGVRLQRRGCGSCSGSPRGATS